MINMMTTKVRISAAPWIWWALLMIFTPLTTLGLLVHDLGTISASALICIVAMWRLDIRKRFLAQCKWFQQHGIPLITTITNVQRSLYFYNKAYYTWKIISTFNNNSKRIFTSNTLWSRQTPATIGTTITVYLDPNDESKYWMDVSELPHVVL